MSVPSRHRAGIGLAVILALALAVGAPLVLPRIPAHGAEEPPALSFEQGVRAHLGMLTSEGMPGIAVLVARDGEIAFQEGFGFADLERKSPVTPETKFRIGSVSKQFVAAAVLRLVEEGRLALSDPVEKFFPGFPRGEAITVEQLLTHTSGIHSYTSKPEFPQRVVEPIDPEALIAWFRDDPPDFAPGEGFLYNNSAYFLAGEVVARVAGMSLADFLRETFFEPLGMHDTGIFVNATPPEDMALGYSVADGKATPALDWDMSWAGGAGALYSTVGDLFRWNEALFGGRVVNEESFRLMTTPIDLPPGVDGMSYGYGLMIAPVSRLPAIGHGGGLSGWSSDLLRLPDQRCTIVVLANALPPVDGREPAAVARQIAGKFLEAEIAALPPMTEDPDVDRATYAGFVGRYSYPGAILTVTADEGRLHAQVTGQERFEIFPDGPDTFFWKVTDARVTFVRDDSNAVTGARHSQGGVTFTAPRLVEPGVKLTEAELDAILGKFQYPADAVLTVTRDGDAVFAQLTGQPKFQIHAKSAGEFVWHVVPASVVFAKDEEGKVIKAVHTQGGVTFEAPKIR